jgi:hypothetical protein
MGFMIIIAVIFVGIAAFLMGLIVGCSNVPQKSTKKPTEPLNKTKRLAAWLAFFLANIGCLNYFTFCV